MKRAVRFERSRTGSGEWIRTTDLRVMSPTSYHCSTPRRQTRVYATPARKVRGFGPNSADSSFVWRPNGPGTGLFSRDLVTPVSSALERFTTVFGMGTGGTTPL